MAQIKLNTIQIVLMAHYKKLLIQIVHMAHICENDMIQIKDMFQIVATWLQFSTEEYSNTTRKRGHETSINIEYKYLKLEKKPSLNCSLIVSLLPNSVCIDPNQ